MEGPFYPDKLPLDQDNDLVIINDNLTPAVGEITNLTGRILTANGSPIRNAIVEIWQVDSLGNYIHSGDFQEGVARDRNFQGYGKFETDSTGVYFFRTIKPVTYKKMGMFRAPHIHFKVSLKGKNIYTGQLMIKGHADNQHDSLLNQIWSQKKKATILREFTPEPNGLAGELSVQFDIIVGHTLSDH